MKNQADGKHPEGCKCWACQGKAGGGWYSQRHSGWYHLVRWILGIAVIVIVFMFGMMIGQLKGELAGSGRRMMRAPYSGGYGRAYPMVQGGQGAAGVRPQAAPSAPSTQSSQ